ncbi:MAG: hypothetical protein KDK71_06055 [Chlamydiia bacterium]|nr:hypothetical protein [Chlamydiia bacterium]
MEVTSTRIGSHQPQHAPQHQSSEAPLSEVPKNLFKQMVENQPQGIHYAIIAQTDLLSEGHLEAMATKVPEFNGQDFAVFHTMEKEAPRVSLRNHFTAYPASIPREIDKAINSNDWDYLQDILHCIELENLPHMALHRMCDFAIRRGDFAALDRFKQHLPPESRYLYKNRTLYEKCIATNSTQVMKNLIAYDEDLLRKEHIGRLYLTIAPNLDNFELYEYLAVDLGLEMNHVRLLERITYLDYNLDQETVANFLKTLRDHPNPIHQKTFASIIDSLSINPEMDQLTLYDISTGEKDISFNREVFFDTQEQWENFLSKRTNRLTMKVVKTAAYIFSVTFAAHLANRKLPPIFAKGVNLIGSVGLMVFNFYKLNHGMWGRLCRQQPQEPKPHSWIELTKMGAIAALEHPPISSNILQSGSALLNQLYLSKALVDFCIQQHSQILDYKYDSWVELLTVAATQLMPNQSSSTLRTIAMTLFALIFIHDLNEYHDKAEKHLQSRDLARQ